MSDFRCLNSAELELDPRLTLISGENASGKTSLLEAIYLLGRGRSFRTRRIENLIRTGADRFVVFGESLVGERRLGLGVEGSELGIRARMAGERVASLAELATVVPVQIIDPEVHRLIEEGPGRRRRFLDWGVFHVEHDFIGKWQRYQRVLKQRNAALRARQSAVAVSAWDAEFIRLGNAVHEARMRYVDLLQPIAGQIARRLLGLEFSMSYRSGWPRDIPLGDALKASSDGEQAYGMTQVGPHRAEAVFRLDSALVKDRISRGQQKLLAASLLLAQLSLFPESSARPILLLDDPAAELDDERLVRLIHEVAEGEVQLIVTSLDSDFNSLGVPGRRYVIVAGRVASVP